MCLSSVATARPPAPAKVTIPAGSAVELVTSVSVAYDLGARGTITNPFTSRLATILHLVLSNDPVEPVPGESASPIVITRFGEKALPQPLSGYDLMIPIFLKVFYVTPDGEHEIDPTDALFSTEWVTRSYSFSYGFVVRLGGEPLG
jgi:hypothetical protein